MEACGTAHGWGREFEKWGHNIRLIPPVHVKQFVKRQKHDVADSEAIVKAVLRPTMRFVSVKTEDQQARSVLFRTWQMFVGKRTQMINALRGHLAEHRLIAGRGLAHLKRLAHAIADIDTTLLTEVRDLFGIALRQTIGFVESLLRLIGLDWVMTNLSPLSRWQKTLQVNISYQGLD